MPDIRTTSSQGQVNTRRSQRVLARIRISVRRPRDPEGIMSEVTHTLVVNAHGALIALAMSAQPKEQLIVRNVISGEEEECRVVRLTENHTAPGQTAIEFTRLVPHFWHIDFPPSDWKQVQE